MSVRVQNFEDAFFEHGFAVAKGLFSASEIVEISDATERLWSKAEKLAAKTNETGDMDGSWVVVKNKVVQRIVWAGGAEACLLEAGHKPELLSRVAKLLGSREMDHLLNQIHYKKPGDGVSFPWHQDIQHRDKGPGTWTDIAKNGSYIQTLLVVDPMTKANGPVLFIPGSQKRGRVDLGGDGYDVPTLEEKIAPAIGDDLSRGNVVTLTGEPGDVIFFGPYVIHGSEANTSTQSRRVLINGYAYPGANHRQYPGKGSGQRISAPNTLDRT